MGYSIDPLSVDCYERTTCLINKVVFVITLILAKRKSVTSESKDLKKLKLIRKIFVTPYIVSLIICTVFSFIGVGDFMISSGVDFGFEGFIDAAFVLAFYFGGFILFALSE